MPTHYISPDEQRVIVQALQAYEEICNLTGNSWNATVACRVRGRLVPLPSVEAELDYPAQVAAYQRELAEAVYVQQQAKLDAFDALVARRLPVPDGLVREVCDQGLRPYPGS